jgi:hypothetical protein
MVMVKDDAGQMLGVAAIIRDVSALAAGRVEGVLRFLRRVN